MEITCSHEGIVINRSKSALELVVDTALGETKPSPTLMENNLCLTSAKYDEMFHLNPYHDLFLDTDVYRRLVGRILYLIITRRNIVYFLHYLNQFVLKLNENHFNATMRVIHYIQGSS